MEYISIISAAQRLGISEKEVEKLIQDKKLISKTEYGTTTVTKESVYAHSGISTNAKQTKNVGGRPPALTSYEKAAEMISMSVDDVMKLIASGHLEEAKTGIHSGITMRSIKVFKARIAKLQPTPPPTQEEDAANTNVYELEECPNDEPLDENVSVLDESSDTQKDEEEVTEDAAACEAVPEDTFAPDSEDRYTEIHEWLEKEKAMRAEEASDEEVFTITKRDFYASLTIATMRAELRVYRSMKSFERK